MVLVAARTAALDAEAVLRHCNVHRECGTRVLAAGLSRMHAAKRNEPRTSLRVNRARLLPAQ
jgi:hypothetical protein